jgi:hypothetical protein
MDWHDFGKIYCSKNMHRQNFRSTPLGHSAFLLTWKRLDIFHKTSRVTFPYPTLETFLVGVVAI